MRYIVKAVVAALMPMVQSLSAQIQSSPQISVEKVQTVVQKHDNRLDEIEQYSRRDNVVLRGVAEDAGESTNQRVMEIAAAAGVTVTEANISTSHRVGRPQPNKTRPIIARFVRRDLRTDLLRNKRKLKDTSSKDVMVGEHLSPGRAKLLQIVKQDENTEKVWTIDGRINCTLKNDPQRKKFVISSPEDLFRQLGWKEDKLKQSGLFVDIRA